MQSVETIYREKVMPLPAEEQRRLADMILENAKTEVQASNEKPSALEVIESIRAKIPQRSAAEIDAYIRAERDSWDD
ncbi:MAG: hypothetical protein ACKVRN_11120 [Pyrinomonadaceae bacterium]